MTGPTLELYYFESCPFCKLVAGVIQEERIVVTYKDISTDGDAAKQLLQDTGKRMVPCLYIDGKPMHESKEIISWLKTNIDSLTRDN